ncbi:MAG: hypothetical protein V2I36_09420 [Desulfopila sp.]|jgi:hypothetical protein|nr:hypothetical protein [Desulfopila sp.]
MQAESTMEYFSENKYPRGPRLMPLQKIDPIFLALYPENKKGSESQGATMSAYPDKFNTFFICNHCVFVDNQYQMPFFLRASASIFKDSKEYLHPCQRALLF